MNLKDALPSLSLILKIAVAMIAINTVAKRVPSVGKYLAGF